MATATGNPTKVQRNRDASTRSKSSAADSKRRLLVEPDINGPRVRLGVLWFLLAMAAVTSGRVWIALLCSGVSAVAGYQLTRLWNSQRKAPKRSKGSAKNAPDPGNGLVLDTVISGTLPLLAGYSTGATGLGFIVAPFLVIAMHTVRGGNFSAAVPTLIGSLLPPIGAVSIVLAVRFNLWAGLFLVVAVSLYDAGSFLHGAESSSRWEGPAAGIIGVMAATFTMAVFHPNPLTPVSAAISGVIIAITCPLGQMLASRFLPRPDAKARGLRRLDAYLVAGPLFYVAVVIMMG